jgi:hypothetical protein
VQALWCFGPVKVAGSEYELGGTLFRVSGTRRPSTVDELANRLSGASAPSEDDQSRTHDGEVLDTREAVERFLADVEQARSARQHP